ncbi:SIS domain-containing protein [Microbispora sp. RL4-1S]|uniref:SIS domain-containing protein n=1 Tax=Microbispora oryzae TaxID=2806554 RepID=A0A940WEG8_9ACTN|nr:PfkB family carbohydrate kinase [Microbispora oryzae]MBP2703966.1 SIS domain-containing protein [Microbispora oryzae]
MALPGAAGARRVLVIGNLTIDDVIHPDGTVRMGSPGGNAVYAVLAARLWNPAVGVVTRRGDDLPPGILEALERLEVDTSGVRTVDGPTVRNWVVYEEDGRRHWIYRTPRERSAQVAVRPEDVPDAWLWDEPAPVVHVAAMPLAAAAALVEHVRRRAPGALITLDTHEDWAGDGEAVTGLAVRADVFVPSRDELAALAGYDDPPRAAAWLRGLGVPAVVVKLGAAGALVDAGDGPQVEVPAFPTEAVDATGAGDTFCGALAAALAAGLPLAEAVRRGAATAAWAVAGIGSLALAGLEPEEAARQYAALDGVTDADGDATPESAGSDERGQTDKSPDAPSVAPYDIDVMRREITMIPEVVARHLADPGGEVARLAATLVERGVEHVFLVGCGDSYFAGLATALAFQRHAGVSARAVHALDFARYQVRYLPERSAVVCVSFSGKVGRTTEAAAQARRFGHFAVALTNNREGALAAAADTVLPVDVPTLGFSPGTSTYLGLVATLADLALRWGAARGRDVGAARAALDSAPALAERTLLANAGPAEKAAQAIAEHGWTAFLGAGPNEASAKFGAAKLFEGPQLVGLSTNIEEWAHEEYFVTSPGTPVVVIAPTGAGADRAAEILSEIDFIGASAVVVSDAAPALPALHLPLAEGLPEEFSPLLAALPLSLLGFHLAEALGKQSYNFPSEEARTEHYDTIHRVVIGEPA